MSPVTPTQAGGMLSLARKVVAAVEDLLFRSKISETANTLGMEALFPRSPKKLVDEVQSSPPDLLVLDLNSTRFEPLKLLKDIKSDETSKGVPVIGFLSHVQKDLAVAARESGCDRVMARSAFTKDLPEILSGPANGPGGSDGGNTGGSDVPEDGRWERLSSERLMETPYFVLRSDKLRLPDGAVKDPYYILERPDAAIIFPVTEAGEVVLVRQYRPAIDRMELGLPAGLVEEGEEPLAAARRELMEETGYTGGEWEPLGAVASSPSLKDNWAHLYLARGVELTAPPQPDEYERVEVVLVPVGEIFEELQAGSIVSSSGVAAVLLALGVLNKTSHKGHS